MRVVFDTKLRLSPKSNLALTAKDVPVWVFSEVTTGKVADNLTALGVRLIKVPISLGVDLTAAMSILKENGIASLLVEGGGTIAASFLRLDAIDNLEWFRAPLILGGDGRSAIGDLNLEDLNLAARFNRVSLQELGDDIYERYERCSPA